MAVPAPQAAQIESDDAELQRGREESIRRLREELQLTQSRLRTTREESETVTEELRAANEELQSVNEEYRSTAEELETSKEELQSINEELQTVNSELKLKLDSISHAHSDLQNLMAATDIGTLFLDEQLRIKLFTPRMADLFSIKPGDEGRPITDFTHRLEYGNLAADARKVLDDLTPVETEVRTKDDGWFLARLRPYRTVDNKIDGVVATFIDITQRRRADEAMRVTEDRLHRESSLIALSRSPIFAWEFDGGIVEWNRGSEQLYGYTREEALGQRKEVLLRTAVPGSSFAALKKQLAETGRWSGEVRHRTKDGRELTVETDIELDILCRPASRTRKHDRYHRTENLGAAAAAAASRTHAPGQEYARRRPVDRASDDPRRSVAGGVRQALRGPPRGARQCAQSPGRIRLAGRRSRGTRSEPARSYTPRKVRIAYILPASRRRSRPKLPRRWRWFCMNSRPMPPNTDRSATRPARSSSIGGWTGPTVDES